MATFYSGSRRIGVTVFSVESAKRKTGQQGKAVNSGWKSTLSPFRALSEQPYPGGDSLSPSRLQRLDEICDRFEDAWKAGQRQRIEDYLDDVAEAHRNTSRVDQTT